MFSRAKYGPTCQFQMIKNAYGRRTHKFQKRDQARNNTYMNASASNGIIYEYLVSNNNFNALQNLLNDIRHFHRVIFHV